MAFVAARHNTFLRQERFFDSVRTCLSGNGVRQRRSIMAFAPASLNALCGRSVQLTRFPITFTRTMCDSRDRLGAGSFKAWTRLPARVVCPKTCPQGEESDGDGKGESGQTACISKTVQELVDGDKQ
jgi:hypothetical protein